MVIMEEESIAGTLDTGAMEAAGITVRTTDTAATDRAITVLTAMWLLDMHTRTMGMATIPRTVMVMSIQGSNSIGKVPRDSTPE